MDIKEEYLSNEELQEIFGYGRDKMKRFLQSGKLPVVKINKKYYITKTQLDQWFSKNAGKTINI